MGMRTECRHYESRTYGSGETVRKCRLDAAPEAPWRCPENCALYEKRRFDAGWQYGSLAPDRKVPAAPEVPDEQVASVLDQAEDIVNAIGSDVLAEFEARDRRAQLPAWRRGINSLGDRTKNKKKKPKKGK